MLHSPESMHPQSRYPDGNVTTVVGAGLDELMRHVPSLRPQCIKALVASFKEVRKRERVSSSSGRETRITRKTVSRLVFMHIDVVTWWAKKWESVCGYVCMSCQQ